MTIKICTIRIVYACTFKLVFQIKIMLVMLLLSHNIIVMVQDMLYNMYVNIVRIL